MQEKLRKLAAKLREKAIDLEERKTIKCAEFICGAVGLMLLKRKFERK